MSEYNIETVSRAIRLYMEHNDVRKSEAVEKFRELFGDELVDEVLKNWNTHADDWRRVEDGLPDFNETVLWQTSPHNDIVVGYRYEIKDGWFLKTVSYAGYSYCSEEVIAWMPLPAPFEE